MLGGFLIGKIDISLQAVLNELEAVADQDATVSRIDLVLQYKHIGSRNVE